MNFQGTLVNQLQHLTEDMWKGTHTLFSVWCVSVAQSCLTLHDPMECSPPGFSVHGILQARILEWVAIAFSSGIRVGPKSSDRCYHKKRGHTESPRVAVWRLGQRLEWVAIPLPGDLPNSAIKPRSPALQADSLPSEPPGTWGWIYVSKLLWTPRRKVSGEWMY